MEPHDRKISPEELPRDKREEFVSELPSSLWWRIRRSGIVGPPGCWHLDLARADHHGRLEAFRAELDDLRRSAAREAMPWTPKRVDYSRAEDFLGDEEVFLAMGATSEGRADLEAVSRPGTQARRSEDDFWLRLRWSALMTRFYENLDCYDDAYCLDVLRPRYDDAIRAYDALFDEVLADFPVRELCVERPRQLSRAATILRKRRVDDAPVCLGDLPKSRRDLENVRNISITAARVLARGIADVCMRWRRVADR